MVSNTGIEVSVARPTAAVELSFGDLTWTVKALVDTGAPFTLFDRATADALGIPIRQSGERRSHQIGGGTHLAQVERVQITLPPFNDLSWESDVDFFVDDWEMPFAGLLGEHGFLDRWVVSFHRRDGYFIVGEPESFDARLPVDPSDEYEWRDLGWKGPRRS